MILVTYAGHTVDFANPPAYFDRACTFSSANALFTASPGKLHDLPLRPNPTRGDRAMIGKLVSHYRILEEPGRGGMGIGYKAENTRLDRFVAIKSLPRNRIRQ
ncbi:MAG: hypothetical protein AB1428_02900 [Bacteroidota bacterium]